MATKTAKNKYRVKGRPASRLNRRAVGNVFAVIIILLAAGVLAAVLLNEMQRKVVTVRKEVIRVQYYVVFDRGSVPAWMPPQLADNILDSISPKKMDFNDERLCGELMARAKKNPWVRSVKEIRKVRVNERKGYVAVRVDFRKPFVRVAQRHQNYFIDDEGVLLPTAQVPQWKAVVDGEVFYYINPEDIPVDVKPLMSNFMIICGAESPAPEVGKVWPGDDLQEGLKLAKLVSTRSYARQISIIDVRNHKKRVSDSEPELRMFAQIDNGRPTDIRFGRFPRPEGGDWVITPEQKMQYLDDYVTDHGGRLAGIHEYIDVRLGELHLSTN